MLLGRQELISKLGEKADTHTFLNADTCFGHSQLPQLLKNCGYELYRFQRPLSALDEKGVPREFIYKGLDGTEIFVSRGSYVSDNEYTYKYIDFNDEQSVLSTFKKEVLDSAVLLNCSEDLAVFVGGDDIKPLHNMHDEYE